jgi:pSer/pThr/pTyr-binding forkhead associated (FHA) protein
MTFGTDPTQATNVLDHPSLAPLQARLRYEQNAFTLADQNSVSGCWLNYERLPKEGRALKHGDMIHFGELTYRFVLAKPPSPKKPTLTPL